MTFRTVLLFFTLLTFSLQGDEFEELSQAFSQQVERGIGLAPDLPSSSPFIRRTGDIQQKIFFEDKSQCTLRITFSYRDLEGKEQTATMLHHFFLQDFAEGGKRRFEINHKLLCLSFQDPMTKWHIGFRSSTELTRAVSLFSRLIEISSPPTNNLTSISQTAMQAGFRSLIISPIGSTVPEMAKTLFSSTKSTHFIAFLSRAPIGETTTILAEAENRLPLFVYDLQQLDKSIFYTLSSPYENQYKAFSSPLSSQSILSDDLVSLHEDLKMKEVCYIHFITKPSFTQPISLLYPPCEASLWKKALHTHKINRSHINVIETPPLYWNDRIPVGTDSFWLMSTSPKSDDGLRFWFETATRTSTQLIFSFVAQNYPHLKQLLQQKSSFLPMLTVQECLQKNFATLSLLAPSLTKEQMRVLKIALLTHEMGCSFGPIEEISYNSLPFTLMLSEKVGCTEKEINLLELLLEKPLLHTKENPTDLSSLFQSTRKIKQHNIAIADYFRVQELFFQILSSTYQDTTTAALSRTSTIHRVQEIASCLCLGLKPKKAPLSGRRIYSSYLWEIRDPLHRDGLYLKRMREKFEQSVLEKPDSHWKGKFWEWIENQKGTHIACPTLYLQEDQKTLYKPIIKGGKLYLQDGSKVVSKELMFVVDTENQLYVGQKKDGKTEDELSFSHASFTAGKPVASSGKIRTDAEGRPILLRNESGHYRPKIQETILALKALQTAGINLSTLLVAIKSDPVTKLPQMTGDQLLTSMQRLENDNS